MKKSWAALLCVVYLTSVAGVVGAENNSSTSVVSMNESQNNTSDEQSRRMKDITVTATRTEALVRDVPIATTIISQEEIKDHRCSWWTKYYDAWRRISSYINSY